jgi:hypothetical protein
LLQLIAQHLRGAAPTSSVRTGSALGAPHRSVLIPCSDDLFVILPIRGDHVLQILKWCRCGLSSRPCNNVYGMVGGSLGNWHDCNNNTFTWSGPSWVVGFTGQRRVAPLEHCALSEPAPVVPLNLPFVGFELTQVGAVLEVRLRVARVSFDRLREPVPWPPALPF